MRLWHAGGTGLFAVQLAKLAGMHVIGTCGSADKAAMLRTLGVNRVVNYKQEDLKQACTPLLTFTFTYTQQRVQENFLHLRKPYLF